jgi:NAD(P)-dependent dehydrogenase (short-subunit alcohol dehydrogenase family)
VAGVISEPTQTVGPHRGRVALVTGAAVGIGQAYCTRLAAGGATVLLADVGSSEETRRMITDLGGEAISVTCDVSSPDSVAELAERAKAAGGVDILVHNAGIYPLTMFAEMTFAEWRRVMSVNLDSAFLLAQALVPPMRERGWGRVICIASGMFHSGSPGALHYVASKGGIIGFVRALAAEVGVDGVTVNAIAPGLIKSYGTTVGPHTELGIFDAVVAGQAIKRTGLPEDLTGAVSFLASEESSFMTGQTVLIDGGAARA